MDETTTRTCYQSTSPDDTDREGADYRDGITPEAWFALFRGGVLDD